VWVLESCFHLTRDQLVQALDALLHTKELVVDRAEQVIKALRVFKAGTADFADCLIERGASSAGSSRTMTFDVAAAKTAGMAVRVLIRKHLAAKQRLPNKQNFPKTNWYARARDRVMYLEDGIGVAVPGKLIAIGRIVERLAHTRKFMSAFARQF
jgi:hypothetical protein